MTPKKMATKSTLRSFMKAHLRQLSRDSILSESVKIAHNAVALDLSSRFHPSIFLSMPSGELDTSPLIEELMKSKGHAFIPKVIGGKCDDLVMVPIESVEEISTFPKSKWGIPEPPAPQDLSIENYGMIDVVFVPGVAFDRQCRRLGHGKGYYDNFLDRLLSYRRENNLPRPLLVGLALIDQIVDEVPVESHDKQLDVIVTPGETIWRPVDS